MKLPMASGRLEKVATWSTLPDRDPAYALVEGVDLGLGEEKIVKFLRRIPKDPLTGDIEWGKRSHKQEPDDDLWDGTNVFDVFSLAEGDSLKGTPYSEW